METNKQIRQSGFSRRLKERIDGERPDLQLSEKDLQFIVEQVWLEIANQLRSGKRVIFERYVSFYTKPIKRKCSNLHTREDWITHKKRMRWHPAPNMKNITEKEITEDDYLKEKAK